MKDRTHIKGCVLAADHEGLCDDIPGTDPVGLLPCQPGCLSPTNPHEDPCWGFDKETLEQGPPTIEMAQVPKWLMDQVVGYLLTCPAGDVFQVLTDLRSQTTFAHVVQP